MSESRRFDVVLLLQIAAPAAPHIAALQAAGFVMQADLAAMQANLNAQLVAMQANTNAQLVAMQANINGHFAAIQAQLAQIGIPAIAAAVSASV